MDYWTANSLYIASESRYMEASESRFTCMNERPSLYPHTLCLHQCCHAWDKRWSHANFCSESRCHAWDKRITRYTWDQQISLHCCIVAWHCSKRLSLRHCCIVAWLCSKRVSLHCSKRVSLQCSKRVSLQFSQSECRCNVTCAP